MRRAQVSVAELYTASAAGAYWYVGGWNPRAVAALVPAVLLSAAISFLPAPAWLNAFNWFVSAACAAVLYGALQRRSLSSHVAA